LRAAGQAGDGAARGFADVALRPGSAGRGGLLGDVGLDAAPGGVPGGPRGLRGRRRWRRGWRVAGVGRRARGRPAIPSRCGLLGRLGFRFLPPRPLSPNSPCRGIDRPPRPGVARSSGAEVSLRGAGVPLRRVAGRSNGGGAGSNMLSISRLRRNGGFLAVFGPPPMPLGIPLRMKTGILGVMGGTASPAARPHLGSPTGPSP
jgi:hypothetical protein